LPSGACLVGLAELTWWVEALNFWVLKPTGGLEAGFRQGSECSYYATWTTGSDIQLPKEHAGFTGSGNSGIKVKFICAGHLGGGTPGTRPEPTGWNQPVSVQR